MSSTLSCCCSHSVYRRNTKMMGPKKGHKFRWAETVVGELRCGCRLRQRRTCGDEQSRGLGSLLAPQCRGSSHGGRGQEGTASKVAECQCSQAHNEQAEGRS